MNGNGQALAVNDVCDGKPEEQGDGGGGEADRLANGAHYGRVEAVAEAAPLRCGEGRIRGEERVPPGAPLHGPGNPAGGHFHLLSAHGRHQGPHTERHDIESAVAVQRHEGGLQHPTNGEGGGPHHVHEPSSTEGDSRGSNDSPGGRGLGLDVQLDAPLVGYELHTLAGEVPVLDFGVDLIVFQALVHVLGPHVLPPDCFYPRRGDHDASVAARVARGVVVIRHHVSVFHGGVDGLHGLVDHHRGHLVQRRHVTARSEVGGGPAEGWEGSQRGECGGEEKPDVPCAVWAELVSTKHAFIGVSDLTTAGRRGAIVQQAPLGLSSHCTGGNHHPGIRCCAGGRDGIPDGDWRACTYS
mmetsp:Transcript_14547/g.25830  ORF Transcript_14547/g.25830 Transcript_14547/m.25830 type:complete len:355 (-) Transcript_14547:584-1648(-)